MSQFHRHFKPTLGERLQSTLARLRSAKFDRSALILTGSQLLRFPRNISVGAHTIIKRHCAICACNESAQVKIGRDCTIGDYAYIYASKHIEIGDGCLIAPFAYIVDSDHQTRLGMRIRDQELIKKTIRIGNDVWIGARVTILGGVEIQDGAVVAAGSIVKDDIGPNEIWAGVPARKVGERK